MPRGHPTTEELKAAVIAALMAGMSISDASRQFKLPKTTVARLRSELGSETVVQIGTAKRERINDLLVGLLAANVGALTRFADTTSAQDYIRQQTAEGMSALYGRIADTTLRLLEAASAAGVEAEGDDQTA